MTVEGAVCRLHREIKVPSVEVSTRIELKVNETYTLTLQHQPSTGFIWSYEIEGNSNLVDISDARPDSTQPTDEPWRIIVGDIVDREYTVKALEPGHMTIHFTKSRPWEKNTPLEQHYLEVFIRG